VDLIGIAPETPAGFFRYFIERKAVYDPAYKAAVAKFTDLKLRPVRLRPAVNVARA
jgi:hypothetical protein